MGELKKISGSEMELMNVIWDSGRPISVNDLLELLDGSGWKYTTVATFLTRLTKKGFLKCRKQGNQNRYIARVGREEYRLDVTKDLAEDLYGGSLPDLVACFAKDKVSEKDYAELMDILKKYES